MARFAEEGYSHENSNRKQSPGTIIHRSRLKN